jgi:tetratricopeptide (TPR) repeat protein
MMKGRDMIDHWYLKHGRACVSLVLLLAPLPLQLPAAPVRVIETEESFRVVDEGGGNPRKMRLRQVRLENEYLRVDFLPQIGGRLRSAFDKAAGKELFLVRPILWPKTNYTAYGSQLGGHEINFPSFHHGNNYMDPWNWHVHREDDGTAAVTVGWTDPLRRQRVVVRWQLRPGEAMLRAHYRFTNLNPRPLGFSPWSNMFFGYADDLQYIIPTAQVAPHGFNDGNLDLWPWPWPEWDEKSICFWRNIPPKYNSIFAVGIEEDFHGVYYTRADHGMVRLFDRTRLPGIKMFCHPPAPGKTSRPIDYTEVWTSPVLSHEDMLWWEAFGAREYDEAFFGVHGIGGYRYANETGAVNLTRRADTVELAVCVTRPIPGAVVALSSIDGDWLRQAVELTPERPWRSTVKRAPGREPLDLRVFDAGGRCVLHYAQRPDPGLRSVPHFSGKALWQSSPYHAALKAEQYQALWRGPTGGYGGFGAQGARAFRALREKEPGNREFALGLARSLLTDVQLRQPGQPRVGSPEETAALAQRNLSEAAAVLEPLAGADPRAAMLLGEVRLRQGDRTAARRQFEAAADDPVAAVELSRLAAADGDRREALRHSAAAARLLPGSAPVVRLHAANLIKGGKQDEAKALLMKLVAIDPVDALTAHLLSRAMREPAEQSRWVAIARALLDQSDPPATLDAELEWLGGGIDR